MNAWGKAALAVAIAFVGGFSLTLVACGDDGPAIDVFAASSLTGSFTELAAAFEGDSDHDVRLNFAGTSTLREQLNDGADADVFVAANMAIMQDLVRAGVIDGDVHALASNKLVLAVPTGNPAKIVTIADLARTDLFVGVCALGVPCGDLAQELLSQENVDASVDTFEPNVRSLTNRLIDGELDVALVYATDVAGFPDDLEIIDGSPTIASTYVIAAVDRSDLVALEFVEYALSESGQTVLASWGFEAP